MKTRTARATKVKLSKIRKELDAGFKPITNPTPGYLHIAHGTGLEAASRERCKRAAGWRMDLLAAAGDVETVTKHTQRFSYYGNRASFSATAYCLDGRIILVVANGQTRSLQGLKTRNADGTEWVPVVGD